MSLKQLITLHKFEKDKERQAIEQLKTAKLDYQQNLQRLTSVGEYRLEYMKRLMDRSAVGVDSATYNHFHAFVLKLDNAAQQVEIAIKQSNALVEQKKTLWLQQQRKVRAIEKLLENLQIKKIKKENRQEQLMFDEISTQQFIRQQG